MLTFPNNLKKGAVCSSDTFRDTYVGKVEDGAPNWMQPSPEELNREHIQELISDAENGCRLLLGEDFKVRCRKRESFIPGKDL